MGHDPLMLAIDSNAMTYWIESMACETAPANHEHLALVRIFLWIPSEACFRLTPTVEDEYLAITSNPNLDNHISWAMSHISALRPLPDPTRLAKRTSDLLNHHTGHNDCKIVAECELMEVQTLVTCDERLHARLAKQTNVRIRFPTEYWASMDVARGSRPNRIPTCDNPMSRYSWWRW